jgi:hypothetical protein
MTEMGASAIDVASLSYTFRALQWPLAEWAIIRSERKLGHDSLMVSIAKIAIERQAAIVLSLSGSTDAGAP